MQPSPAATILVVEDEAVLARATAAQLEFCGYRVTGPAHSAAEALACIDERRPDLVLMDIQLDGGPDGIDVAMQLREHRIPVVFLTAYAGDEVLERAQAAQPIAYLVKPLNQHQLRAAVTTALEQARLRRELSETRCRAEASEQRLSTLISNLPGMIYRCNPDRLCQMQYASSGCLGLTGFSAEELVASVVRYADLIHPEDRNMVHERVRRAIREQRPYRLVYRMRDRLGQEKWVWEQGRAMVDCLGTPLYLEGLILDISDQKHIEQALASTLSDLELRVEQRTVHLSHLNMKLQQEIQERELLNRAYRDSQQRYRELVESINDWVWEVDVHGVYTYASPRIRALLGYEPQDVIGKTPFELMPEAEAHRVRALFTDILRERRPFDRLENINIHKAGHLVILETSGVPIFKDGCFAGYRGIDRDISERKAMESALVASEERLASILRHTMAVTYVKDLEGRYQLVNPAFEKALGLPAEQIIGRYDHEIFDPVTAERFLSNDLRVQQDKQCEFFEEELRIGNEKRIFMSVKFPLLDAEGRMTSLCGMSTDITDRLVLAEQERDTLVREVHHRIKNHLQGVVGLLRMEQKRTPGLSETIARAVQQVQSIALVYGLQSYTESIDLDLNTMVNAIFEQVRTICGADINPIIQVSPHQSQCVSASESVPLALILNELITNAFKHACNRAGQGCVSLKIDPVTSGMVISIWNHGQLPSGFDWYAERGLGTGLRLLRSLMPHHGARLEYRQDGDRVVTRLILVEPLVIAA